MRFDEEIDCHVFEAAVSPEERHIAHERVEDFDAFFDCIERLLKIFALGREIMRMRVLPHTIDIKDIRDDYVRLRQAEALEAEHHIIDNFYVGELEIILCDEIAAEEFIPHIPKQLHSSKEFDALADIFGDGKRLFGKRSGLPTRY